jgi:hypothetical protein
MWSAAHEAHEATKKKAPYRTGHRVGVIFEGVVGVNPAVARGMFPPFTVRGPEASLEYTGAVYCHWRGCQGKRRGVW